MSSTATNFTIRVWGARGSIPAADPDKREFGGNTPCVSFQLEGEAALVLDAGSGIRSFGEQAGMISESRPVSILFSHFHWDHIQGFPFLPQLYSEQSRVKLYSTFTPTVLERALRGQMCEPYFPIPFSAIRAQISYEQIAEEGMDINGIYVQPVALNHPGGCSGYRLDSQSGSAVYATDHEHGLSTMDAKLTGITRGADVLIYDAHFTEAEYRTHQGWGHSTSREACRLAERAEVESLVLFHHSPTRTDAELRDILADAKASFLNVTAAREGESITLSNPPGKRSSHA